MDAEQQRRWDEWCDARIEKMMDDVFTDARITTGAQLSKLYMTFLITR
jgi:hypothetical protein